MEKDSQLHCPFFPNTGIFKNGKNNKTNKINSLSKIKGWWTFFPKNGNFSMIHIDWLTIYQDFPGLDLPVLGEQMIVFSDLLTGEIKKERVSGYHHEGSL